MDEALSMIHAFGVMALATGLYGIVQRLSWPRRLRHIAIGLVFGTCASVMMLHPVDIAPGVIFDARAIFVAFSAAFLGPLGAATALLTSIATRLSIGGDGAALGALSLVLACSAGLFWGHVKPAVSRAVHNLIFGALISLSYAVVLFLPSDQFGIAIAGVLPLIALFNIVGTLLFGSMIERERRLARRERELSERASIDHLTGVMNRRAFEGAYAIAASADRPGGDALLLVDLDHFKRVNDTYGHVTGDAVLVAAARAIAAHARPEDVVGRIGGEEFAVLLPSVSRQEAQEAAGRLCRAIRSSGSEAEGHRPQVTASIGGVYFAGPLPVLPAALRQADARLYEAKSGGRNRVVMGAAAEPGPRDAPTPDPERRSRRASALRLFGRGADLRRNRAGSLG